MGNCESICQSSQQKPINDKICEIKSNTGWRTGIGFFCKIHFPKSNKKFTALFTSNILNIDDSKENQITLNFLMGKRVITLNIDNSRKYYISREYNISIVEIKENELNFLSLLELNESPDNNLYKISLINYGYNKTHEEYYAGQITSFDDRRFEYTHSYNINDYNNIDGCPILDKEYKIIGIATYNNYYSNKGMFLNKPIEDFYLKYNNNKIKVIFHVSFLNKEYIIDAEDKYIFGELIIDFYLKSGLEFDYCISFFYNNKEIPSFSIDNLFHLNIQNYSKIYIIRKQYPEFSTYNLINLNIKGHGVNCGLVVNSNIRNKELILLFCQKIRYPYSEVINNCKFIYNANLIRSNEDTINSLGLKDGSSIIFDILRLHTDSFIK